MDHFRILILIFSIIMRRKMRPRGVKLIGRDSFNLNIFFIEYIPKMLYFLIFKGGYNIISGLGVNV